MSHLRFCTIFFRVEIMFGKKEKIVLIIIAIVIGMLLSAKGVLIKVIAGIIAGFAVYKFLKHNNFF